MTTITPSPASAIGTSAACIVKKAPLRHVSSTASQSSSDTSSVGRSSQMPAQCTSTSSWPYRSIVAATSARQSPTSRTSPVTQPCLPAGSRLSATAFVLASSLPATMTAQPSTARRRAQAAAARVAQRQRLAEAGLVGPGGAEAVHGGDELALLARLRRVDRQVDDHSVLLR